MEIHLDILYNEYTTVMVNTLTTSTSIADGGFFSRTAELLEHRHVIRSWVPRTMDNLLVIYDPGAADTMINDLWRQ